MKYNRKDNDGHKFNVPKDKLDRFDALLEDYLQAKRFSPEYYDLETAFCNEFAEYMVG
jgi:hypothetical protein